MLQKIHVGVVGLRVNCASQVSFSNNSFEGFSPLRADCSTQVSVDIPDQNVSCQFPEPPKEPLFPFKSKVNTWIDGMIDMDYHRDIAELSTKEGQTQHSQAI